MVECGVVKSTLLVCLVFVEVCRRLLTVINTNKHYANSRQIHRNDFVIEILTFLVVSDSSEIQQQSDD